MLVRLTNDWKSVYFGWFYSVRTPRCSTNIIVTKAIREIIWENVSSLGFLRKRVRVIVRLRIHKKEKTTDRDGTHEQSDDTWRTAIVRGNSDGATDNFPVSRRRSQFFAALPKTRAGTTTRLTGHRACVTAIRRSRRTSRRRGYKR